MQRKPPNEWDDELELEEAFDLDDHELDFKLQLDRVGKGAMRPLNIASVPREEGEGFVEEMEAKMDKLTINDILQESEQNDYDPEDIYDDGESYFDEDEGWGDESSDGDMY